VLEVLCAYKTTGFNIEDLTVTFEI